MPERQFNVPIPGIQIHKSEENSLSIVLKCSVKWKVGQECPRCSSSSLKIKAYVVRELKHSIWEGKLLLLHLKVPKIVCKVCKRYFMAHVPGVLPKKRATERFRKEVFELHHGGITQKHLSITHGIGIATVERWYQDFVVYRVNELKGRPCPLVLGIDEHFFTRKKGYATTLVDLKNNKVFNVSLGRSEASLKGFLSQLVERERVQVAVMDLSETYRSLVQKYFPNAKIVADRFHVVRLLNQQFMKIWGLLDPVGRKNRGLLSLLRRHEWNLRPEQIPKLQSYFDEVPGLEEVYRFKQDLMRILLKKHQTKAEVRDLIPQLLWHLEELLNSPWEPMQTFGKTLQSWLEPIVRMWRFSKNNGITEGFHNKMEMISRRAFGFRNFQNYRLRVIALCGWNGLWTLRN